MKALPNSEMNSRSPRVVSRPRIPRRGAPPGAQYSHTDMPTRHRKMKTKNAAVGHVQAIQSNNDVSSIPRPSDAPERETLGDVVADEVDHDRAGDQSERPGGGKQAKLITRGTRRLRHQRRDRLRGDCSQRLRQEQLDPREHEAEEAGDPNSCGDGRHEDAEEEPPERV